MKRFSHAWPAVYDVVHEIERFVHEMVCLVRSYAQKTIALPKGLFSRYKWHICSSFSYFVNILLKEDFSMSDRKESVRISRQLHAQETRECIEKIFGYRHRRTFISFAICSF